MEEIREGKGRRLTSRLNCLAVKFLYLTFPKLPFPNSFRNLNSSRRYFRMGLIGATMCCGRPFISDLLL